MCIRDRAFNDDERAANRVTAERRAQREAAHLAGKVLGEAVGLRAERNATTNVVDLINAHRVLMSEDAVRKCEALWGGANLKPSRGKRVEEAV